jgi:hypothetical protein
MRRRKRPPQEKVSDSPSPTTGHASDGLIFWVPSKGSNLSKPAGSASSRFNQPGQSSFHTQSVASSQPPINACWHCGDPGHFKNNCPHLKTSVPAYSNSVNGPKNVTTPASKAPSTSSQLRKTQFHARARVNHVHTQEAQQAPGVVISSFLVEFTLADVLFDSRASHSFIATSFVEKHGIPTTPLEVHLVTRTLGSDLLCHLKCCQVRILLSGVVFLADLVILPSHRIDVILGMDWLSWHNGIIDCVDKTIILTDHQGKSVSCKAQPPTQDPMVFSLAAEGIYVVEELMDVFPKELPGMPPEREVEFYIDLPGTAPIAKRPYHMTPIELAELKF